MFSKNEEVFKEDVQISIEKNKIGQDEMINVFRYFSIKFDLSMSVNKRRPPRLPDRRVNKYRRIECDEFHKDVGKNVFFKKP